MTGFRVPVSIGHVLKSSKQVSASHFSGRLGTFILLGTLVSQVGLSAAVTPLVSIQASTEADLLEPERAFQLFARHKDPKTVELQYKIADGYYLYRARFKFAVEETSLAKLGKPKFSPGKMKQDPTFGRVETYRNSVRILLPVANLSAHGYAVDTKPLRLKITSQGCSDAGICYPPLHQTIALHAASMELVVPDGMANMGSLSESLKSAPRPVPPPSPEVSKKTK